MTKNPVVNSLLATGYIVLVVFVMNTLSGRGQDTPDTFLAPVLFISMFSLSAVMMALLFGYQPFKLYTDGKKKEAINLVFKTVLTFAITTSILLALVFSGFIII